MNPGIRLVLLGMCACFATSAPAAEASPRWVIERPDIAAPMGAFAIGDRLRIVFFEQMGGSGRIANLIERTELSGEYVVFQGGSVHLPLIGEVEIAGKSHRDAEQAILERLGGGPGAPIRVAIQIVERPPVLVVGAGSSAKVNSIRHAPGMTVLRAIAQARQIDTSSDVWRQFDLSRETERSLVVRERLATLYAARAVIEAERTGTQAPLEPSGELLRLLGRERAVQVLKQERELREVDNTRRKERLAEIAQLKAAVASEISALKERVAHAERTVQEASERVRSLSDHHSRGVTTENNVHAAKTALSVARDAWLASRAAIAQAERRTLQIEQERSKIIAEALLEREQRWSDVNRSIRQEEVAQRQLADLLGEFQHVPRPSAIAAPRTFIITRRTAAGVEKIDASADSNVEPGDIIEMRSLRLDAMRH
jgi:protein involved in polysaccharide export with SLBB domain